MFVSPNFLVLTVKLEIFNNHFNFIAASSVLHACCRHAERAQFNQHIDRRQAVFLVVGHAEPTPGNPGAAQDAVETSSCDLSRFSTFRCKQFCRWQRGGGRVFGVQARGESGHNGYLRRSPGTDYWD